MTADSECNEVEVLNMGSLTMVTADPGSPRSRIDVRDRDDTEVINIKNCHGGLGIKIAGGRSALGADFGIFVKKVLSGGAADLDGQLREGDQLLEVNGCSLLGVSNDKAMSLLRNAAQTNNAKMVVSRDVQARQEFEKLMTALNGGSTLSGLTNGSSAPGLTRSSSFGSSRASTPSPTMGKRSWVMTAGRMSPLMGGRHGSPVLSPTSSLDRPSASLQRMYSMDLPTLSVGPPVVQHTPGAHEPPSYNSSLQKLSTPASRTQYTRHLNGEAHSPDESPEFNGSGHLTVEQQSVSSEFTNDSGLPTDRHSNSSSPTFDHPGELQTIQIRYSTGLGLCIVGGTNRPEGPHIYVDDIIEGGDSHKDRRLKKGDRLIYINGETLIGVTHEQAKSLLTRLKLRGQDTEVTFIRGGHRPGSHTPNGSASPAHNSPRRNSENGFPSTQNFHLNLSGLDNSSSRPSSSRSSQASEPDLSNTDVFMKELLAEGLSQPARTGSRESSLSVETFQGSPQSQISPPALSDSQPAVMQPTSHPVQPVGGVMNHSVMPNSHPQLGNGFYPAPSAVPQRVFGSFQPAMSSTPTTVDSVPNRFPVNVGQAPWSSSPPYVNGVLGNQPRLNQPSVPLTGNGAGPSAPTQPQQLPLSSLQISPVQTAFEQSSVPYYLQQDLEALQRVAQQYTSPPPGQQSSPSPALRYLGYTPTEDQQRELRQRLPTDQHGLVSYGDFVNVARQVFDFQLKDHSLSSSAVQFAVQDVNAATVATETESYEKMQQRSQLASLEAMAKQNAEDAQRIRRERDEALREVQHLKKLLKKKEKDCLTAEEELMKARRDAEGLLEESRSLEKKVHLASEAQKAAKDVEQDYEEVIRLLEKELDTYKAKQAEPNPDVKDLQELQKRLVVLGCQLRKAEVGKRTYEVATDKLIHFAELVHETLSEGGSGTHVTQQTSWLHPVSQVQHLPPIAEIEDNVRETQT
ncbi:Syntaxin-binding protein 4 [Stylophora pistillata]|uniref:Syntaxin-binding protein 4 n=1 Tax=Stylophora pistillata TaxID=50429 RepID=A0A2B4SYJ9_STYPI|nr:Syntaxin-binding protein 4 [Stylophora pistillata]